MPCLSLQSQPINPARILDQNFQRHRPRRYRNIQLRLPQSAIGRARQPVIQINGSEISQIVDHQPPRNQPSQF